MVVTRGPPDGMSIPVVISILVLIFILVLKLAPKPVLGDPEVAEPNVAGLNETALLSPSGEQPMKLGTDTLTVSQV